MTRSRWVASGLLVGAFVLGGLVGGAATLLADRQLHNRRSEPLSSASYVDRLSQDLSLSPAQRDSVAAIVDRHQPAMDSIWDVVRPQFETEREAIRSAIQTQLTADQAALYQQLIARKDSIRRASRRHGNR